VVTMSTYTPNVPQSAQRISQTQPLIQDNFLALDAAIQNDHIAVTDATVAKRMLHKQVTFPDPLGADPAVVGNDGVVYTKDLGGGLGDLFFKNASLVTQLSGLAKNFANPGYANLSGGLQVRFGTQGAIGSGGFSDVNFNAAFTNNCLAVVASCSGGTAAIGVQLVNSAKFQAKSSSGTVAIQYIAIGY
jgi:hypothetical protein